MRKRKPRSRVLRAGNDKSPKEKADNDKTLKEKTGNDKALKGKAGTKEKTGNDKTPKAKSVNDKAPTVKAGSDKAPKGKAGNDKVPKEKAANEKLPKEKAANTKQVQSLKENTGKQAAKAEAKRRAPHKRNPKARRPVASRRLISARDAEPEDYPYMVSIQKDNEHWCSGAILNPQLIISTANCFWKSKAVSRMKIRAGSHSIDTGGQIAYIAEVRKHPNWSIRKVPNNDIALALLDRQLRFSDAVHAVDLPNKAMIPPFEDVWVTSYGAERRDGVFSRLRLTLQALHMRMMPEAKCAAITKRFGVPLHDSFFCLEQIGRRAPCTRDTGAPAVSDGVIWGLASWGIRKLCGTQRFPAMFSYVADATNIDFIVNATSEMMGEERKSPFLDRPPIRPRQRIRLPGEKVPE
ncbi:trypsin delta-like [Cydia amplana]|uniref:trypsin delta-like n=1 Tax=Cydia amplana TaxID=1869771 RepID=UPI002FE62D4B